MGETKDCSRKIKADLDHKFQLSGPTREILEELALNAAKENNPDATFQYAFCLSKSTQPTELRYAITILDGLVRDGYEHQMDCMYGSACALYLLDDFEQARSRCESILRTNPESRLALELHLASIASEEQKGKEQVEKMATIGAVAVAAIGVAGMVASALLKK